MSRGAVFACVIALAALLPASARAQIQPAGSVAINITPIIGGTSGRCLYDNAGKVGETASCGLAGGITVGTSVITGGTTTRVLFDNAGVLGEYTATQLTALINPATATLSGALPAWPNNTTTYFRGDGTYATHNCASITNAAASCATDATNASNIGSGTLPAARLSATAPSTSTPTPTCGSSSGTLSSVVEYVQQFGSKWVNIAGTITVTTLSTCATSIILTLPVTGSSTYGGGASGINLNTGKGVLGAINPAGPTVITFVASDGTGVPATGNGQTISFSGGYFTP